MRALLLAAVAAGWLSACGGLTCDEDHEAVAAARALSDAELAALFTEAQTRAKLPRTSPRPRWVQTPLAGFAANSLAYRSWSDGKSADVILAHCFDHGVDLHLAGLDTTEGQIELSWGEGPTAGHEILWTQATAAR